MTLDYVDAVELILESSLFVQELSSDERQHVLQEFLRLATMWHRPDLVRLIMAHGADINRDDVPCLQTLMASGVFCELLQYWGSSVNFQKPDLVRALIECGVDARGDGRFTPLHWAGRPCNFESIKALVTLGFADVNAVARSGLTPLMCVVMDEHT